MTSPLPSFSEEDLATITTEIKDYQVTHGSLIKLIGYEEEHSVPARPIGATLYPTKFPRKQFQQACFLAPIFDRLYAAISEDEEWLSKVLKDLIEYDPLVDILWSIYREVKQERYAHRHVLNIFRSDYMLETGGFRKPLSAAKLKQVEFNAYSCAGGTHGNIVANMHRHLARKGLYGSDYARLSSSVPRNETVRTIVNALEGAKETYKDTFAVQRQICTLIVVQPRNINICDERAIEYGLWDQDTPIYRVVFGEMLASCRLGRERELLFKPPYPTEAPEMEVAVVYMRAAYDIEEYDDDGIAARLMIERSRAIKCPSIGCHLATLKKVQQELTVPGALSRFLPPEEVRKVQDVSMQMFPLDESIDGQGAQSLATDRLAASHFVLKPSLEGGGHNIYRTAIPEFLARLPHEKRKEYILMEMITPPEVMGAMISWTGRYIGPVVSELGIFSTSLWTQDAMDPTRRTVVPIREDTPVDAAWSLKTKARNIDEMSVIKGYGCFDSPLLVDDE